MINAIIVIYGKVKMLSFSNQNCGILCLVRRNAKYTSDNSVSAIKLQRRGTNKLLESIQI